MGHYSMMRGVVKIKPELVETLRPRFTKDSSESRVEFQGGEVRWTEALPFAIASDPATLRFTSLIHSDWLPGVLTYHDHKWGPSNGLALMEYSQDGTLEFISGFKYAASVMRAFIDFLPLIAKSWIVEIDASDELERYDEEDYANPNFGILSSASGSLASLDLATHFIEELPPLPEPEVDPRQTRLEQIDKFAEELINKRVEETALKAEEAKRVLESFNSGCKGCRSLRHNTIPCSLKPDTLPLTREVVPMGVDHKCPLCSRIVYRDGMLDS